MSSDDHDLIVQAQNGDVRSFEQLCHRYDKRVLSIALSYTNDEDEAKDIYQESFIRIYRALPKFQFRSQFSTWLFRIVTNVCLTYRSKNKAHQLISIDETYDDDTTQNPISLMDDTEADELAIRGEISSHVENAMTSLSPQQRLVFSMRHFDGLKLKEIASMMECAEGTVKKYLFTATERMRERLKAVYQ